MGCNLTKEYLKTLYYDKGHTLQEIANLTNFSYKQIYKKMVKFDLKRRTLSEAFKIKRDKNPRNLNCLLCGVSICLWNYLNGTKLCRKCAGIKHSKVMKGKLEGSKHHNYIDGRSLKNSKCVDCGTDINYKATRCGSCSKMGKLNIRYNNASSLYRQIRTSKTYNDWRKEVLKRDNYTCQECCIRGGKLEVHHIRAFILILNEFLRKYNNFSILEEQSILFRLASKYEPFWDLDNGQTLCKGCHKKTDNYSGKLKIKEFN